MNRKKKSNYFPTIYLTIFTVLMYIPIILTIVYSFNESKISSIWGGFSDTWYRQLFADRDLWEAVRNSVKLALLSCVAANVIGITGALGMRYHKTRFDNIMSYMATLPIMIPEIILGMAFLAIFSFLKFPFGMLTLVIAHTSFCVPYIFLMVRARLTDMDATIEEAARDLGASPVRTFWDITFPSIFPAVLSGTLLAFAMSFDDVVISIFVTGATTNTLAIKIYTKLKTGITPEINALATIMLLIVIGVMILYAVIKKAVQMIMARQ